MSTLSQNGKEISQHQSPRLARSPGEGLGSLFVSEGPRGSSLWQRRQFLSRALPALFLDLETHLTSGLSIDAHGRLVATLSGIAAILDTWADKSVMVSELDGLVKNLLPHIVKLGVRAGNAPNTPLYEYSMRNLRSIRKQSAASIRSNPVCADERIVIDPFDQIFQKLTDLVVDHPGQFFALAKTLDKFWYRSRSAIKDESRQRLILAARSFVR